MPHPDYLVEQGLGMDDDKTYSDLPLAVLQSFMCHMPRGYHPLNVDQPSDSAPCTHESKRNQ